MLTYKAFIFIAMALLHILEDFHLQGILANMKQKSWWQSECTKPGISSRKISGALDSLIYIDRGIYLYAQSMCNS